MENQIWLAMLALIPTVTTLTEFFKRLFKVDKKWFNELLTVIICFGTAFVAWILGYLGTFFTPEWACVLVEGCIIFAIDWFGYNKLDIIKKVYDLIFSLFGKSLGGKWYDKVEKKNRGIFPLISYNFLSLHRHILKSSSLT